MLHLSQSKIAIAVGGNYAFALALCTYKVMIKVGNLCPGVVALERTRALCLNLASSSCHHWLSRTVVAHSHVGCFESPCVSPHQVFLGSLREAEVERINDRISQAIMETCLAMTIFREEFNIEFCAMFTVRSFCGAASFATAPPCAHKWRHGHLPSLCQALSVV